MWYFLPTHPLILNFYYFVNCFTFIFICYYYYIILYYIFIFIFIFIFHLFIYFLSPLSSLLSLSLFPHPTYPHLPSIPPCPRPSNLHSSSFFLSFFYFFSPIPKAWCPPIFFCPPSLSILALLPPLLSFPRLAFLVGNPFLLPIFFSFSSLTRVNTHFFLHFFFFSLQLSAPTPIPVDAFSGIPPSPFSSSHSIFFIFILFPKNPSTLTVTSRVIDQSSPTSHCLPMPPSPFLSFSRFTITLVVLLIIIIYLFFLI